MIPLLLLVTGVVTSHNASSMKCPARSTKCLHCGVIGHFAKVCNKKNNQIPKVTCLMETDSSDYDSDPSDSTNNSRDNKQCNFVLNINSCDSSKPLCIIQFGGIPLQVAADSGSPFTIIAKSVWDTEFVKALGSHLEPTDILPESFTGDKIDILGYRSLMFVFKNRTAVCKLYVAAEGPSVLGWKDQGALHIILDPNSPEQILVACDGETTKNWVLKEFPHVFSGKIDKLKGFAHLIRFKSNAVP